MKIVILGAGIVGVTTAYYASKAGHDVTVIDKDGTANKCSYANGGQISVCNSQVWNTWSNVIKGIKWLGKENAPLLIRPDFDSERISWLLKFLKEVVFNTADKNTLKTIALGLKSRQLYNEMLNDVEDLEWMSSIERKGILHIYTEMNDYYSALSKTDMFTSAGLEWEDVPASKILKLEPRLISFSKNIVGGIYTKSDFTGDIHRFCIHLMVWLQQKGVKFIHNLNITSKKDLLDFSADKYILCSGSEIEKQSRWFAESLDVYPVKGYSITIDINEQDIPNVSLLDEHAKIVCSKLGNKFRVAGTAEFCGHDDSINPERIKALTNWVNYNFFNIDNKKVEPWACLRPMRPDMLPVVGKFKYAEKDVFYNGGHGHLGWTLAPVTAQHIIELL